MKVDELMDILQRKMSLGELDGTSEDEVWGDVPVYVAEDGKLKPLQISFLQEYDEQGGCTMTCVISSVKRRCDE